MRYPDKRLTYIKTIGNLRVRNVVRILKNLGFDPIASPYTERHGVDIWVWKEFEVVLEIEVTNWRNSSNMSEKKLQSVLHGFDNPYSCTARNLLIYSFNSNMSREQKQILLRRNIDLMEIGFQTQPICYFIWFFHKGLTKKKGMKPISRKSKRILRRKLTKYLTETNLL